MSGSGDGAEEGWIAAGARMEERVVMAMVSDTLWYWEEAETVARSASVRIHECGPVMSEPQTAPPPHCASRRPRRAAQSASLQRRRKQKVLVTRALRPLVGGHSHLLQLVRSNANQALFRLRHCVSRCSTRAP